MVLTMPSPTRAMIVSSVAPPTSCCRFVRTVTRARARTWMPSFATAAMEVLSFRGSGQSMTFGFTLVWMASRTSRPARSIAAAVGKSSLIRARSAAMSERTTEVTLPPAR